MLLLLDQIRSRGGGGDLLPTVGAEFSFFGVHKAAVQARAGLSFTQRCATLNAGRSADGIGGITIRATCAAQAFGNLGRGAFTFDKAFNTQPYFFG